MTFPHRRVHLARTRLAFVRLDNLLYYAKHDREGMVDGYLAAYLPDELVVLLLSGGEIATAVAYNPKERFVRPLESALEQIRSAGDRGEITCCDAPLEQLAWMYQSCAAPAKRRTMAGHGHHGFIKELEGECYTGVIELIVSGLVTYLGVLDGKVQRVYSALPSVPESDASVLDRPLAEALARDEVSAFAFPSLGGLPRQAPPPLVRSFRDLFWSITDAAQLLVPGESGERAVRIRSSLAREHPALSMIGADRDNPAAPRVVSPEELTDALADWASALLDELEEKAPGSATRVLQRATRDHRVMLEKAGFYQELPWKVNW